MLARLVRSTTAGLLVLALAVPAFSHEPGHGRASLPRVTRGEVADRAYHYFLEGRTLARRGYVQAAIETLELACKLAPREGGYQLALAKLLRESGEPRGAVMHLRFAYETGTEPVREQAFKLLDELGYPAEPEEPAPVPVSAFANKGRPRPSTASGAAAYETTH